MRKDRRGFVRASSVERVRLKEFIGRFEDAVVRTDEASGGMTGSAAADGPASADAACASLRAFCRLRCGRSTSGVDSVTGAAASFAGIGGCDAVNEVDVDDRAFDTMAVRGRNELLRKYPARSRCAWPGPFDRAVLNTRAVVNARCVDCADLDWCRGRAARHCSPILRSATGVAAPSESGLMIIAASGYGDWPALSQ
jgi:hypothetical protein